MVVKVLNILKRFICPGSSYSGSERDSHSSSFGHGDIKRNIVLERLTTSLTINWILAGSELSSQDNLF